MMSDEMDKLKGRVDRQDELVRGLNRRLEVEALLKEHGVDHTGRFTFGPKPMPDHPAVTHVESFIHNGVAYKLNAPVLKAEWSRRFGEPRRKDGKRWTSPWS
tara:strand:- start:3252 stop:3557 length:306 start_codon:yes stop_codon:yes gene_type:complete